VNDSLIIRGAREHNLKGVDLDLPRDTMIVFTGLSGSGKSSLAFDTIFAEGQRRYVESLSSYARQFLGQMDKPDVELIEGLSPAVSIDQKSTSRNPRSTVGTVTEIYDYLRLLYARAGIQHCPVCDAVISSQTPQQIVDQVRALPEGTRFQVLAPVVRGRKGEYSELFGELRGRGFNRVRVDGAAERRDTPPTLNKRLKHDIEVIVDRLVVREGIRQRLTDSVETALGLAEGLVIIELVDLPEDDPHRERRYSEKRACPNEHPLALDEMEPRTFSFNAPYGACPACTGIGTRLEVDPELVVPDEELTLAEGAVAPWSSHQKYFTRQLEALGKELSFDVDTPWRALPARAREAILRGKDYEVKVTYRNRWGRERIYSSGFEGVLDYVMRKHDETESDWSRERYQAYMREIPCPVCDGARLKPEVLAVRVGELSIAQLCELPINEARDFLADLNLTGQAAQIAGSVLTEINARLGFLVDVGLDYLSLARGAATLSGGEAQRIRLATQIGSGLVGVLYVLDEPSIGLHQRDNTRLIETLQRLRDLGNTLIVVEHDEDTIRSADWIVDIGPGAGELGGEVVYSGNVAGLTGAEGSITGDYLARRREIEIPAIRRKRDKNREVTVVGARENNLKDVTVSFPLGVLTAVTGVSGSGKSSLVNSILYQVLANRLNRDRGVPGRHKTVRGVEHLDKVVHVDQSPIGRTPRSNPATYTGVWDHIRKIFAAVPESKVRGYGPGRFSFNVKGGRCESCKGDGTLKIEMNFLPDVYVPCEVISRHLNTLVEVGLGYVRLGQSATTLSGGEAQRVKLATELQRRSTGRTIYVLDEPTTGLHFEDIRKLLGVLQGLVDKGNSVVVIEHNLDVIANADWVIDMGPEGGKGGGTVVVAGTPEKVAATEASYTGQFLAPVLEAGRG